MITSHSRSSGKRANQGISLIIVLIMMVIIGVTAATAMRSATSEQHVTNNLRMEGTAQQYAEAALRYCEAELQKADAARVSTLQAASIPVLTAVQSGWEDPLSWSTGGGGLASASLTEVPAGQVSDANTVAPSTLPQCVAEVKPIGITALTITIVTARGFSPDYVANVDGTTLKGTVVWLQSFVNI